MEVGLHDNNVSEEVGGLVRMFLMTVCTIVSSKFAAATNGIESSFK